MAAFARKILGQDHEIHTFTIGLENAPDFKYARAVAEHIRSVHHEFTYTLQEGLDVIPQVNKIIQFIWLGRTKLRDLRLLGFYLYDQEKTIIIVWHRR